MEIYEIMSLLFLGGSFLIALRTQLVEFAYDRWIDRASEYNKKYTKVYFLIVKNK